MSTPHENQESGTDINQQAEAHRRTRMDGLGKRKFAAAAAGVAALVFSFGVIDDRPAIETLMSDPGVAVDMVAAAGGEAMGVLEYPAVLGLGAVAVGLYAALSRRR